MDLMINSKKITECCEEDLHILIDNPDYRENQYIDYKSDFSYFRAEGKEVKEKEAFELRKDICSFANAEGGFLIYGISERKGIASNILGVEIANCDRFENDVRNLFTPIMPKQPNVKFYFKSESGEPERLLFLLTKGMTRMATGEELSRVGFKYIGTPYSVMDCQKFVERCLADVGIKKDLAGSNAWYRFIMAHGWVGSPEECRDKYGHIPVGAFLFILKSDGREPEKYKPDGIGNASHIGIYTATGKGAINSSSTHGCVCESNFQGKSIRGGWNRVGLWNVINYGEGGGGMEVNYQARVVGGALKLRKQPSQNADLVCRIPDGTVITITEEDGEWGRTTYNSESGWVMLKYTEKLEPDPSGDTVTVARADLERMYDQIGEWLGRKG